MGLAEQRVAHAVERFEAGAERAVLAGQIAASLLGEEFSVHHAARAIAIAHPQARVWAELVGTEDGGWHPRVRVEARAPSTPGGIISTVRVG